MVQTMGLALFAGIFAWFCDYACDTRLLRLGVSRDRLEIAADPARYTGRAPEQVDEFLTEVIEPMLAGSHAIPATEEIRV